MNSLPKELDVEISSRVASDLASYMNIRLVSKAFREACDNPKVLRCLNLQDVPRGWVRDFQACNAMLKRCRQCGNPEALFRKGFKNYFINNKQPKGLKLLEEAANKGCKEAAYVYGVILICLGNDTKNKGFAVLSTLMKPSMKATMDELVVFRGNTKNYAWWRGRNVLKALKDAYVREECSCDGATLVYLNDGGDWDSDYGTKNDINTSISCAYCLWDHETNRLFERV